MEKFDNILALISAAGAFGLAAYGVVEALGKSIALRRNGWTFGLPFVGFPYVYALAQILAPALRRTYGDDFIKLLAQQYREGRGKGEAPSTLRQGVLLALPFMPRSEVAAIVDKVWGLGENADILPGQTYAERLAEALTEEKAARGRGKFQPSANDAALAGRFTTALDARIQACFAVAEQRYGAQLRLWAGLTAVLLAVAFNSLTGNQLIDLLGVDIKPDDPDRNLIGAGLAALFGAVSVPLAPVANDLVSALSQAMKAWRDVSVAKAPGAR